MEAKVFLEDWGPPGQGRSEKTFRVNKTINTLYPRTGEWLTKEEVEDLLHSRTKDVYIERHKTKGEVREEKGL